MDIPTDRPASAPAAAAARRVAFGFGPREIGIGVLGLALLTAVGVWLHHRFNRDSEDLAAVRSQLALRQEEADLYRQRFADLQATAAQIHAWAESQTAEPTRTWARERARRFDTLVAQLNHEDDAHAFADASHEIERLGANGDVTAARAQLAQLTPITFPSPSDFARQRHDLYEVPLAAFSRQNPDYYQAFRRQEPEMAARDATALRAEIASGGDSVTPQLMLKVDLLAVVAPPDDPVVAEWSALASAMDYFEDPDGATLAHWRKAQHALQQKDWQTATNEMQSIVISKVRTRQPFRAAYGRVLIKTKPDEAYPFEVEAAAAGDRQARAWVAQQDYRQKRYGQAQRWLEAAVADGDKDSIPLLVELYDKHGDEHDAAHETGVIERVTDRPDAPADAWLLLGRLYERTDPPGSPRTRAFACYVKAANKGSAANAEVARCALRGIGTPENLDQARDAACAAFNAGDREHALPMLIELMRRAPEHSAGAIAHLFDQEQVGDRSPYMQTDVVFGPGVSQLKALLAAYFDQAGMYASAARFYGGSRDLAATHRRAELTAAHPCPTCGGLGKVIVSVPCPTCGGSGKQICSYCGGTGYIYIPGTPPCLTCGGTGVVMQDRKPVACATCGGTGKGKGNVIKQDCPHCDHGYIRCTECNNGVIKVTKDCPDCHGKGTWSLAERSSE